MKRDKFINWSDDEAVVRAAFPPWTHWFQRTAEDWKLLRANSKQVQDFEQAATIENKGGEQDGKAR